MHALFAVIPPWTTWVMWVPLSGMVLVLAAGSAAALWRRGLATPDTRKVFHFLIFSTAAGIYFRSGVQATSVFGTVVFAGVLYAVYRGDGFPFYEALARPSDAPRRSWHVIAPLLATAGGGLAASWIAGPLAPVALLVGGWGDALGEPVGTRWGRHRFYAPSLAGVSATRSLEGSGAVFGASLLAALAGLALLDQNQLWWRAFAVAATATVVEVVSPHGLDNFLIQAACAWTCTWSA